MTSEEFWFGNPQDYFVYQDAFAEKTKMEHDLQDAIAWIQGRYNLLAFSEVAGAILCKKGQKPKKVYPEEPFSVKLEREKNKKPLTLDDMWAKFKSMANAINKKFEK